MKNAPKFQEDLQELVYEAATVAAERCGACRNIHTLWPIQRIARVVSGVEGGGAAFAEAIASYCETGPKRILIAGAADTGILCLAANASSRHGANFLVIDICDTPLELCRRFAKRWGLPVETQIADVNDIEFKNEFDIVIAHSLLQYIPPNLRVNVYSRFAAALRPDGVVIQIFNASARVEGAFAAEFNSQYPDWVMTRLEQCGVTLPEPADALRARLQQHSLSRGKREGAVATPEEVDAMMAVAGFSTVRRVEIPLNVADSYGEFVSKLSKRRYLSVARVAAP